jgi:hypothetical protein
MMELSEFKDQSINGQQSVVTNGAIMNVAWTDLFVTANLPKTEADGKMSWVNPALNVKGSFYFIKRNAIQRWFARDLETQVSRNLRDWYLIEATANFGFGIANKKAGQTVPFVVGWINVTL